MGTLLRFLAWRMGINKAEVEPGYGITEPYVPPYATPDIERIAHPDPASIQLTWVGHSTFLIQAGGYTILTDPIWSERASPVQWAGPKRHARPGIPFEALPRIDIVLISHTHYDHLDRPTVQRLGASPRYVLPTDLAPWFAELGIRGVTELPWWSSADIGNIKVTAVPAKHWSKRNLWGEESAGWGGYLLETPAGAIYFAGDTGYDPLYFKEIGKRFPRVLLALIPVGAYYPRHIFGRYHIDPREAVMVHREIGAERSIGMHWGTFKLTEEPLQEPPLLLASEAAAAGVPAGTFSTMKFGETILI